jgi:hypothetical protein
MYKLKNSNASIAIGIMPPKSRVVVAYRSSFFDFCFRSFRIFRTKFFVQTL